MKQMISETTSATARPQFGYELQQTTAGWAWSVYDPAGRLREAGVSETRALAAAHIIRVHATAPAAAAGRSLEKMT